MKLTEEEAARKMKEDMERTDERTGSPHKDKSEGKPLELIFPSLPVNPWKPLPEIPIERIGSSLNKKVCIYKFLITGYYSRFQR